MGSLGLGRGLKSFVEVLRFVVTEYRGVGSHGDPIRDKSYDLRVFPGWSDGSEAQKSVTLLS